MGKIISWGGWGIVGLMLAVSARAAPVQWLDKSTIVVDEVFQFSKPGPKWDTQKAKEDPASPVKWILHKAGRNPLIKLTYQTDEAGFMGKTAKKYAAEVKDQYRAKGIFIHDTENRMINGKPVALLHGTNPEKNEHYLIGVWKHKNKGFILECSAKDKDFAEIMPQFREVIETARIVKQR